MVASGLRRYKEDAPVRGNIRIHVDVLPFGRMKLMFSSSGKKGEGKKEIPVYSEPSSTDKERMEILYEGRREYKVPKTTDGW